MATAVLRSQDCLRDRFRQQTLAPRPFRSRRNRNPNPNPNSCSKAICGSNPSSSPSRFLRRKRSPAEARDGGGAAVEKSSAAANLVMEKVTILKRGERLSGWSPAGDASAAGDRKQGVVQENVTEEKDLALCSTKRLGPEPETVQKQIRVSDVQLVDSRFAGSVIASPPPSSVPLPLFFDPIWWGRRKFRDFTFQIVDLTRFGRVASLTLLGLLRLNAFLYFFNRKGLSMKQGKVQRKKLV